MLSLSNAALQGLAAVPSQLAPSSLAVDLGAAIHSVVRLLVNQRLKWSRAGRNLLSRR